MANSNWRTILGLVLSGFGAIAGLSTFVFIIFGNYHAAIWALVSGILATIEFHLLVLQYRGTLVNWHTSTTVGDFQILAMLALFAAVGATGWFIFMFLYYNLPILPIPDSYQIASVWSFMAAKWGLGLTLTARHLARELQAEYPELLHAHDPHLRSPHYYHRIRGQLL